ncbi:MAG TPA: transcriptional regulator NrdR [Deltaproteobacteria bacterium]|nr:transcriptional regulator NrdR [Deltaproteobacteria bacterium]
MRCPRCSGLEDKVIQSRISRDGSSIRRRRECARCSHRYTTYEKVEENLPLVVKKDGRREAFDPNKVITGITTACEKRPVGIEEIESVKESIIHDIQSRGDREIPSAYIGEKVMEALSRLDPVAYVRFASVYREFKDMGDFMKEIQRVDENKP